jgi:hypothetical protein
MAIQLSWRHLADLGGFNQWIRQTLPSSGYNPPIFLNKKHGKTSPF